MARTKLVNEVKGIYHIQCLGCGYEHEIYTKVKNYSGAQWSFSGTLDKPTFSPSINYTWGYMVKGLSPEDYKFYRGENRGGACHFFVRDGKIQYLGDCTHHLKGQTIDLPDI